MLEIKGNETSDPPSVEELKAKLAFLNNVSELMNAEYPQGSEPKKK